MPLMSFIDVVFVAVGVVVSVQARVPAYLKPFITGTLTLSLILYLCIPI